MANTTMLVVGAMGLLYLMRNQGAGTDKPGTLASLLGADLSSSGVSAFGGTASAEVLDSGTANVAAPFDIPGWLENLNLTAEAVDPTTKQPDDPPDPPPTPEIKGTLSKFFAAQGPTVSEASGMAVRQVGLLGRYDPLDLMTSNYPQIGFVDIESGDLIGGAERGEIGDQKVQVLRPAPGPYLVETIVGDDGTTVVTSNINKYPSFFSDINTIIAAVDQGYFGTTARSREVVLEADAQSDADASESAWDAAHGFADRHAVVVPAPTMIGGTGGAWLDRQSWDLDIGI
jgi:hypothetical protein